MNETPRRGWFRFSLGTLFVTVTLTAILLGGVTWERRFALERKALAKEFRDRIGPVGYLGPHAKPPPTIPFWRYWLGDEPYHEIVVPYGASKSDYQRARQLFPEAEIYTSPSPDELRRYFTPPRL